MLYIAIIKKKIIVILDIKEILQKQKPSNSTKIGQIKLWSAFWHNKILNLVILSILNRSISHGYFQSSLVKQKCQRRLQCNIKSKPQTIGNNIQWPWKWIVLNFWPLFAAQGNLRGHKSKVLTQGKGQRFKTKVILWENRFIDSIPCIH